MTSRVTLFLSVFSQSQAWAALSQRFWWGQRDFSYIRSALCTNCWQRSAGSEMSGGTVVRTEKKLKQDFCSLPRVKITCTSKALYIQQLNTGMYYYCWFGFLASQHSLKKMNLFLLIRIYFGKLTSWDKVCIFLILTAQMQTLKN